MTHPFPWLMLGALLVGCGSDDDSVDTSVGGTAACEEDEFALTGSLDGQTVVYRGALAGHAWIQAGARNTFDTSFEGGGRLHTEWGKVIADGEMTAITGSIALPPGGARAGAMLDAASGLMKKLDEEVRFELTGLSEPVTCIAAPCPPIAVEGTLNGCAHFSRIRP